MKKGYQEFGLPQVILSVVIVLLVTGASVFAWYYTHKDTKKINSFETCKAAGKAIMETYPEQCAANGVTYTNPDQKNDTVPSQTNDIQAYSTQEACEQASGKSCSFSMCDYAPEGKTLDEVCGKGPKKGWRAN